MSDKKNDSERTMRAENRLRIQKQTPPQIVSSPITTDRGCAQLAAEFSSQFAKLGEEMRVLKADVIDKALATLTTNMQSMKDDLMKKIDSSILEIVGDLRKDIKHIEKELEKFKTTNEDLQNELELIKKEKNATVDTVREIVVQNGVLKTELDKTRDSINKINQHALSNCIEIGNVPQTQEDLPQVAKIILENLGMNPADHEISSIYRKGGKPENSGLPKPIIVKFSSKKSRDTVLQKSRKTRVLTSLFSKQNENGSIVNGDGRIVYISEHLTAANKYIHKRARELKREGLIKFVWIRNGIIFTKKEENCPPIIIANIKQLDDYRN